MLKFKLGLLLAIFLLSGCIDTPTIKVTAEDLNGDPIEGVKLNVFDPEENLINVLDTTAAGGIIFVLDEGWVEGNYLIKASWVEEEKEQSILINNAQSYEVGFAFENTIENFVPTAYWSFDNTSGNIVRDDYGTNNGEIFGATQVPNSIRGKSLLFDGDKDYVNFYGQNLNLRENASIITWIFQLERSPQYAGIYSDTGQGGWADTGTTLAINPSGSVRWFFNNDGKRYGTHLGNVPLNSWTQVAATFDGSTMSVYVNGEKFEDTNPNVADAELNYGGGTIGKVGSVEESHFNGVIDEVSVYDVALPEEEIKNNYNNLSGGGNTGDSGGIDGDGDDPPEIPVPNTPPGDGESGWWNCEDIEWPEACTGGPGMTGCHIMEGYTTSLTPGHGNYWMDGFYAVTDYWVTTDCCSGEHSGGTYGDRITQIRFPNGDPRCNSDAGCQSLKKPKCISYCTQGDFGRQCPNGDYGYHNVLQVEIHKTCGCRTNEDCSESMPICYNRRCVECASTSDCQEGYYCDPNENECIPDETPICCIYTNGGEFSCETHEPENDCDFGADNFWTFHRGTCSEVPICNDEITCDDPKQKCYGTRGWENTWLCCEPAKCSHYISGRPKCTS